MTSDPAARVARWLAPLFAAALTTLAVAAREEKPPATPEEGTAAAAETPPPRFDPTLFQALEWRSIGPYRGGRSTAVAGVPQEPLTFYFGATGGGLWRTTDGGLTWHNVSDGHFRTGSVGAIAVAPSDPNVIYVGMGEAPVRGVMTTHGDGLYRSRDRGRSFQHVGLSDSRHIARIRVHPGDPDVLWVAVQGHLWGPNDERGIYKSTDGGDTFRRVLFVDDSTGASDLALDVTNPRILYAAMWQHRRRPWRIESGGPGSGLYRSSDGGETWEELTDGLPELMGKIGVAVSAADPLRVWALIEAEDGGLFRSDDGGTSWQRINDDRVLRARAWYYTHVFADPVDADTVYVLNAPMMRSTDGGKTFERLPTPHGDNHDLWINPHDNRLMINANDGGANVSSNGGASWSTQANQPTGQFYRVITDNRFPYWVYGGQQDNSAIAIKSRSLTGGGIGERDWHSIGGCESAYPAFDPDNPRYVYAGCYQGLIDEYDMETGASRSIMAYPYLGLGSTPREVRYRFNWNAPILVSPHDPRVVYHAGNRVLKTSNRGVTWEEISPDLTRDQSERQGPGGGPITNEAAGGEVYNTILSLVESPHEAGVLWTGSDDGLVHLTRDGGVLWVDVTPEGIGEAMINAIEISPHDPATAYLAVTRYKWDDLTPYVFVTSDYGETWERRVAGIPGDAIVRVVREDPARPGLLYAGTEIGVFVSFDHGERWQPLDLGLPVVPVTDLTIRRHDLVASTQGRGFWILDDLTPLHQLDDEVAAAELHLFAPRPAYRTGGGRGRGGAPRGQNPPAGVVLHYLLGAQAEDAAAPEESAAEPVAGDEPGGDPAAGAEGMETPPAEAPEAAENGGGPPPLVLEIVDQLGRVVRRVTSEKPEDDPEAAVLTVENGMNRFVWNMRRDPMLKVPELTVFGDLGGYRVRPGIYRARLSRGDLAVEQEIEILPDPRLEVPEERFADQERLLAAIRDRVVAIHDGVNRMRAVREQVEELVERTAGHDQAEAIAGAAETLTAAIDAWEEKLVQRRQKTFQDVINFPNRLNAEFLFLMDQIENLEPLVTDGQRQRFADLDAEWQPLKAEMDRILNEDLAAFNRIFADHGIPAVIVPPVDPLLLRPDPPSELR